MSPVQPPLPAVPPPTRQPPVVPPRASGSTAAGSTAAPPSGGAMPTGPVDWMPLPPEPDALPPIARPGAATGPAEAPAGPDDRAAAGRRRVRLRLPQVPAAPRGGRGTAAAVLGAVGLLLLELGLVVREGGTTLWGRVPLWAGFATAAAVVALAAVVGLRAPGPLRGRAWAVGAGGLTGVAVFWVLVVLPTADTDRGFVLTAALACLGGCLWLTAGRGRTPATGSTEEDAGEADAGTPRVPGAGDAPPAQPVEEPTAAAGSTAVGSPAAGSTAAGS